MICVCPRSKYRQSGILLKGFSDEQPATAGEGISDEQPATAGGITTRESWNAQG